VTPIEEKLNTAWWVLRVGLGLGALVAGLDKFSNLLTTWSMYLSPLAERMLPVDASSFLRAAGIAEVLVGLAILTRFTRLGARVLSFWLIAIAVNLAASGNFWDLALRDIEIALSAFALGHLTVWRATARQAAGPRGGIAHGERGVPEA
jgi:uncharacterized membrane protein YphA (DoxX/SURF4 family)